MTIYSYISVRNLLIKPEKPVGEKPDLRSKNFFVNKKIFPENFSRKIFGFTEILLSWVSVSQIFY